MNGTDQVVQFCNDCDNEYSCKICDKVFDKQKPRETTSFHQIKKDLTVFHSDKTHMIVDLGCPNSVIGARDVNGFKKCLSDFQQENIEMIAVDDKFKFGPSGPYKSTKR